MSLRVLCPARSSQPQKGEASTDEVTRQSGFPDLHNSVPADTRSFQDRVIVFPPLAKAAASCLTSLEQSARAILMDVVSTLTTSFFVVFPQQYMKLEEVSVPLLPLATCGAVVLAIALWAPPTLNLVPHTKIL